MEFAASAALWRAAVSCALTLVLTPALAQQASFDQAYEALPLKLGAFDILPSAQLRGGYTDNAARGAGAKEGSSLLRGEVGIEAASDWSRHQARLDLRGRYTAYQTDSALNDGALGADAALRLDIASADRLDIAAGYELTVEDEVSDHALSASTGYTHVFNRLSATMAAAWRDFRFGSRVASLGSFARDNVADYREGEARLRLAYLMPSEMEVFAQASANRRIFADEFGADGQRQGSDGFGLLAGLMLDNGSKLRGSFAAGYRVQTPDEAALKRVDALILDADIVWDASALTSLNATAASDIGETTLAGSAGYVNWRAGVGVTHALRRNLLINADLTYDRTAFDGADLTEQTYEASVGVEYRLDRRWALTGEVSYLAFNSSSAGADYRATTVMLGVEARP